jgi:anti-sigma B factor antagonist
MMQEASFTSTGTTIVRPSGHLNTTNASALQKQLAKVVSDSESVAVSVDMSAVESLDSAGLMVLVSTLTLSQQLNKSFSLFGVSPSVRIIFELTQLDRVFEIIDLQAAKQPFKPAAQKVAVA